MTVPWRYILGLLLGLLLGLSVFVGLLYTQLGIPTNSSLWIHDISQKKERLAAQISGPRLFVVAGSSALLGINAQLIEKQTGFPTINMGTHAGLSLDYRLYRIKKIARPGDIVLLACEYEFYSGGFAEYSEINDDYILSRDPEYFRQMSLLDKIGMATRVDFTRLKKGWKNRRTPERVRPPELPYDVYTPITPGIDCLNDHGDEIFNSLADRPLARPENLQRVIDDLRDGLPSENTPGFRVLTAFLQWAHANHVTVLATFPNCIHQALYDEPQGREAIETITHFYTSHGVPVIGTAEEAMLPSDQFYDTMYHLTYEMALKRTERLIPELQPYLHPSQ